VQEGLDEGVGRNGEVRARVGVGLDGFDVVEAAGFVDVVLVVAPGGRRDEEETVASRCFGMR